MNRLNLSLLISAFLFANLANANDGLDSPDRFVMSNQLPNVTFSPPGFDDNDNAEIVLQGYYMNTCYQSGPTSYRVDAEKKEIVIENQAYYDSSCLCLSVLVPYTKTVHLGKVPAGEYALKFQDDKGALHQFGNLGIAVADNTSGPDDFIYAPVDDVVIESNGSTSVKLKGEFTSDCMKIKEVKVMKRTSEVVEVLPLMEVSDGDDCGFKPRPYETSVDLGKLGKTKADRKSVV